MVEETADQCRSFSVRFMSCQCMAVMRNRASAVCSRRNKFELSWSGMLGSSKLTGTKVRSPKSLG